MSKQSLLKGLQSVENMHEYMGQERTQQIITDIRASIENSTTLRDQFAMCILPSLMLRWKEPGYTESGAVAEAYSIADMMMTCRVI